MTNREWLERLSDAQLAEFVCGVIGPAPTYESAYKVAKRDIRRFQKWLKEERR